MRFKNLGITKKITLMMMICILLSIVMIVSITLVSIRNVMFMAMDSDAKQVVNQVQEQIGLQDQLGKEMEKTLEDDLYNALYSIGCIESYTNEMLKELSNNTKIAEINVVSTDGIILFSNLEDNIGYLYKYDHAIQAILKGQETKIVEAIRKSTIDNKKYKYAAIRIPNRDLLLQIGISAEYVGSIQDRFTMQNTVVDAKNTEDIRYIRVVDTSGNIIASTNHNEIGTALEENIEDIVKGIGEVAEISFDEAINHTVYRVVMPLQDSSETIIGAINVGVSMKSIEKSVQGMMLQVSVIVIILFVVLLIATILVTKKITRPLIKLSKYAEAIAGGDLTAKEQIKLTNDEVGKLVKNFNHMVDSLKDIAMGILNTSEKLSKSTSLVATSTRQITNASEQISSATDEIAKGSYEQVSITGDAKNNAMEIDKSVKALNDGIDLMRGKSNKMVDMSRVSRKDMKEMNQQIDSIMHSSTASSSTIKELIEYLNKIDSITDVINSIASQTNMLALNASIEAARAGEHGKGFAVVADEVRKLAEESLQSAKSITSLIQQTQLKSNQTIEVINDSVQQSVKGQEIVGRVAKSLKDIIISIEAIEESFNDYELINKKVKNQTEAFIKQVENIENISQRASDNTQEVAVSIERQVATLQEISASVENMSNMVEELKAVINRFKL